jgi:tRNA-splicing ligase RtcB
MCAVRTSLTDLDRTSKLAILSVIRSLVPLGFKHHNQEQDINQMPDVTLFDEDDIVFDEFKSAQKQLGTLGGGKMDASSPRV